MSNLKEELKNKEKELQSLSTRYSALQAELNMVGQEILKASGAIEFIKSLIKKEDKPADE